VNLFIELKAIVRRRSETWYPRGAWALAQNFWIPSVAPVVALHCWAAEPGT